MKKKIKFLLIFQLIITCAISQNNDYEIIKDKSIMLGEPKDFNFKIIDESGFYDLHSKQNGISSENQEYSIIHYNKNYVQTSILNIESSQNGTIKNCLGLFKINNKIYIFTQIKLINNKTVQLFVQEVQKGATALIGEPQLIHQYTYLKKNQYSSYGYYPKIINDSICVFNAQTVSTNSDTDYNISFITFDKNFKILWEKDIPEAFKDIELSIARPSLYWISYNFLAYNYFYDIDNQGTICKLYKLTDKTTKSTCENSNGYKFELVCYYNKGNDMVKYPIIFPNKYIVDMKSFISKNQSVILFGYYSNTNSKRIDGCFYQEINFKTRKLEKNITYSFDENFLKELPFDKDHSKYTYGELGNRCGYEYVISDIFFNSDNVIIITEQYSYNSSIENSTTNTNSSFYNYNSILVTSINKKGEIEWVKRIPKYQYLTMNEYLGYSAIQNKDNIYLIFNDNPQNNIYKTGDKLYQFNDEKQISAVIIKIDRAGNINRNSLINSKDNDNYKWFIANNVKKISDNSYVFQTFKWQSKVNTIELKFK